MKPENVTARPPGKPGGEQDRERTPLDRKAAGPVRHRRQKKAGDHGADIAEQHLMDMPVPRREGGRQRDIAGEYRKPQRNHGAGIDGAEQKERPEAVGEQRRPLIGPQFLHRRHG
jgi:hypothetical protein